MLSRYTKMANLAIMTIVLTSFATNALALSDDAKETNYTIRGDDVILNSILGDIKIPIPEEIRKELNDRRVANNQNGDKKFERLMLFGDDEAVHSKNFADFFECNEQAQVALSVHSENYRNWEAFFKRNTISDTLAVRYCCNLLEYVDTAQMRMSPECRDRVRLQEHVLTNAEVRFTCRKYEFHTAECFLVRWMYWWISIVTIVVVVLVFVLICCAMKSRRSKAYSRARQEEKKYRTSLVNGVSV